MNSINYFAIPGMFRQDITVPIEEIYESIYEVTGVNKTDLISKNRHRNIADTRKILIQMIRDKYNYTLSTIGKLINRDHATVIHSLKASEWLLEHDKLFRSRYDKINNIINKKSLIEDHIPAVEIPKEIIETACRAVAIGRCINTRNNDHFTMGEYRYELMKGDVYDRPYYRIYITDNDYKIINLIQFNKQFITNDNG